jgi:glycerol transport system permease protein
MEKWADNKAWFLVLPVFVVVAFSAIIPLMTVVNYSIQDIFGPGNAVFVGTEWFKEMLTDHRLHDALGRQFIFSGLVLLIEIPLGILIALAMPKKGWGVSASLVTLALPLSDSLECDRHHLDHFHPAGYRFVRGRHQQPGPSRNPFDHTARPAYAWVTLMAMEVWHWTPLVALLAYAGLRAIPEAYYQAAKIDGASSWAVPLYPAAQDARGAHHRRVAALDGQLSHLCRTVCAHRRRAGQFTTTFLSIYLVKLATGQFDLGPAAAFSLIYFLIVLLFCFIFYQAFLNVGKGEKTS